MMLFIDYFCDDIISAVEIPELWPRGDRIGTAASDEEFEAVKKVHNISRKLDSS